MKSNFNKIQKAMGTRLGFVLTLLILYWLKTLLAYTVDFNLDIQVGKLQGNYLAFIAFFNPLPLGLLLLALALYARSTKIFYGLSIAIYSLLFIWLYSNVFYYREFSDFITANTMKVVSKVSVGTAELELLRPWDFIYFMDFPLLAFLFYKKLIQLDKRPFKFRSSVAITALSALLFSANLFLAEIERPDLLSRGFSNYYVVRALSLPAFLCYSANQSYSANKERAKASETDLQPITDYIQEHSAKPNPDYFGLATGLFGLDQGSFMVNYGGTNTQQAAPFILSKNGYQSSAVFHGNIGTFWNRNTTYKQWGYQYFFDASYFTKQDSSNSFQYGLNDKIMMKDSIQYLEHLQQPFYAKYITVSNHYPYASNLTGDELGFPLAKTKDETINGYFQTANYLDSAIRAFFDYLKESGLYEKSIIVIYGDHYGISNSRNPELAPLIGKTSENWSNYDNAMLQRVPFMVVMPGYEKGQIINTYGGQIDILPTLEHLLGIESNSFLQVGQDLLSPDHQEIVAFRTANSFVTPKYTSYDGRTYYTESGLEISNLDEQTQTELESVRQAASQQLKISDQIQTGDLIRFYQADHLGKVDTESISYLNSLPILQKIEQEKGSQSTSLFSHRQGKTSTDLFKAPSYQELHPESAETESKSQ